MRARGGPPAWFVFILGMALVFAGYYLWTGLQSFIQSSGQGIVESTQQAVIINTATAVRRTELGLDSDVTARPSFTPIPPCELFVVSVPSAIVRSEPNTTAAVLASWSEGTEVCVKGRAGADSTWYVVDLRPETRLLEEAFMREDLIRAVHPTPTATRTFTPAPTVTPAPTLTPSNTAPPLPTITPNPQSSPTPTPSETPTPTVAFQSA